MIKFTFKVPDVTPESPSSQIDPRELQDAARQRQEQEYQTLDAACLQMEQELQATQNKLSKMASPVFRNQAQNQVRQLHAKIKMKRQRQRALGVQLRIAVIRDHLQELTENKRGLPPAVWFKLLCEESFDPIRAALIDPPYGGQAWKQPLEQFQETLTQLKVQRQHAQGDLKSILQRFRLVRFPEKANPHEKALLQRYVLFFEQLAKQMPRKEAIKLKTPYGEVAPEAVEISRYNDFGAPQAPVSVLQETKKHNFETCLREGIQTMEKAFATSPPQSLQVQTAINLLTEALKMDAQRFEPYFSLGYIFTQLEDWTRALKLLDKACERCEREDVFNFRQEIRVLANKAAVK